MLLIGAGLLLIAAAVSVVVIASDNGDAEMTAAGDLVEYGNVLHSIYTLDISHPASLNPSVSEPQPQIELPKSFGNLGRVVYGGTAEETFVVRNVGQSDLTIHNIYSTCTFVTAELTSSVIGPGKAALLTVTLHADEYPTERGSMIRRGVALHSDDPLQSETMVWIQARIIR